MIDLSDPLSLFSAFWAQVEREFFPVEEIETVMYHVAIAITFVDHHDYFDLTAHYYFTDNEGFDDTIRRRMIDRIYRRWSRLTGYHKTDIWYEEPRRESDVQRIEHNSRLVGKIETEGTIQ